MEWADDAVVLSRRRHGEAAAVVTLLARDHGRHAGLVRGADSRSNRGVLLTGNLVAAVWRARLDEHLGTLRCELRQAYGAAHLADPGRLAALASACALVETALLERQPQPALFAGLVALLDGLASPDWPTLYVRWELGLLGALGFGLDLSACTVTGTTDDLAYVSPRSGRAVSRAAAGEYAGRMLPLPPFLIAGGTGDADGVLAGLRLSGYFLDRHALAPHGRALPAARARLVARLGG